MSSSNSSDPDPWFYDESWNWFNWNIFVWLFPLVCLLGALVNACSFYVIATNRKVFPYVTRQYMLIITMNDLIILGVKASTHYFVSMSVAVRFNAWTWYKNPRNFNLPSCIVYEFFSYYALFGAQFYQLGLTIDRLIAVAVPLRAKHILTRKRSCILLFVITVMALLLPTMFVVSRSWNNKTNLCDFWNYEFYNMQVYQPTEFYFGRVFLLSVLSIGTVAICLLLVWNNRKAQKMQMQAGSDGGKERNRSLIRITLILVFINVTFLITSVPYSVVNQFEREWTEQMGKNSYIILLRYTNILLYLNSALNWPLYFMGRNFRNEFLDRFAPCCVVKPSGRSYRSSKPDGSNTENTEMGK